MEKDNGLWPDLSDTITKVNSGGACTVCGSFKLPHEEFCGDCTEYKQNAEKVRKARARARRFGSIY